MATTPRYKIFSFYKGNVNPKVPRYQKAVFRYFGQTVHHVVREDFEHGDFLNHICRTEKDTDYLIFFDIDCIPVSAQWLPRLLTDLQEPQSIAGAAQTANHLGNGENLYIGPFFFGIATAYLRELGYPDMRMTDTMDAGQNLTAVIAQQGGHVKYWWPTHIEEKEWKLFHPIHTDFGPGTTYNDLVYHAFFSRFDLADRFVIKSKQLIKGSFYGYKWPWKKVS